MALPLSNLSLVEVCQRNGATAPPYSMSLLAGSSKFSGFTVPNTGIGLQLFKGAVLAASITAIVANVMSSAFNEVNGTVYRMSNAHASDATMYIKNGSLFGYGRNLNGQLGIGSTTTPIATHTQVTSLGTNVASVACGQAHTAIVNKSGRVLTCGLNSNGQLGHGNTTQLTTPTMISTLTNVKSVSCGANFTLALTEGGAVWAWGQNNNGQLGQGNKTQRTSPVQITSLSNIVAISCTAASSFALNSSGLVYAWGNNFDSELGDGTTTTPRMSPAQVANLSNVVAIANGWVTSFALTTSGQVYSWGNNASGELGMGDQTIRRTPTLNPTLSNIVAICGGGGHAMAVNSSGELYSWGLNSDGRLGLGSTTLQSSPKKVNLSSVEEIACGGGHSIARTTTGHIYGWGANWTNQVNGTAGPKLSPVLVVTP